MALLLIITKETPVVSEQAEFLTRPRLCEHYLLHVSNAVTSNTALLITSRRVSIHLLVAYDVSLLAINDSALS